MLTLKPRWVYRRRYRTNGQVLPDTANSPRAFPTPPIAAIVEKEADKKTEKEKRKAEKEKK